MRKGKIKSALNKINNSKFVRKYSIDFIRSPQVMGFSQVL